VDRQRKLTNMIWRSMRESVLFSILLTVLILYALYQYDYLQPAPNWGYAVFHALLLFVAVSAIGAIFAFWQISRIRRRLDMLHDSMLQLEKGTMSRDMPDLGEDEVGRLGEQLGKLAKKWEEQVNSLQRLSTHNAELAERARFSAVTEERQRLARELHDAVSQQLFAISMTATALSRTLDKDLVKAERQVALIEEMASVAQSEMRALLLHLRPVHLEGKRLTEGIRELVDELRAKVPIDIVLEVDEEVRLNKGVEDHLFRIVQEALSNTLRHSKADRMEIRLKSRRDSVRLYMRDNGVGFDMSVKKQTSYGLVSMQERVNEIGGSLSIVSAPGKGTRIDIRIPIVKEKTGTAAQEKSGEHAPEHSGAHAQETSEKVDIEAKAEKAGEDHV